MHRARQKCQRCQRVGLGCWETWLCTELALRIAALGPTCWTVPCTQGTVSVSSALGGGRQGPGDSACRGWCGLGGCPQRSGAPVVPWQEIQEIPSCQQQLFFSAAPDLLVHPESLQCSLASPAQVSC